MTRVVVFGGSGYAGSHIVEAAAVRGLDVVSITRKESANQIAGVEYRTGSLLVADDRAAALQGADAIVVAVSPRGDMAGRLRAAIAELAAEAAQSAVRLGVIGGAGSLRTSPDGPLLSETSGFPAEIRPEAQEMGDVLEDLRAAPEALDWFFVSPAAGFGSRNAGEYRGEYRIGGDVLLADEHGASEISGADFGVAMVDELEEPQHHRARFTLAY